MPATHGGPSLNAVVVGLVFAVVVGAAATPVVKQIVEQIAGLDGGDRGKRVPGWLTGLVERTFFMLVVAYNLSGAVPGMMAWIALKMAANWNTSQAQLDDERDKPSNREILNRRFTALITSAFAMSIAALGGLIGSGQIPVTNGLFWISGAAIGASIVGRLAINVIRKAATRAPAA